MSLNRVCLIGRLSRDPEVKYTTAGKAVAQFGLAAQRPTKNEQTGDYECDFFDVTCFDKTAEFVAKHAQKGTHLSVDGRLRQETWTDKDTGGKRSKVGVVADKVEIVQWDTAKEKTDGDETPKRKEAKIAPATEEWDGESDPFADE